MTGHEAFLLVREKYLEEERGIAVSKKSEEYRVACETFPAVMTIAHYLWARELTKDLP